MTERSQVPEAMGQLRPCGMRAACAEIIATAVKRRHEPQQVVGDLPGAEITGKKARSIRYQMTIAKLPLAQAIDELDVDAAEINEPPVRDLAAGGFLKQQRNVVPIGGTGTGKSHAAIAIARACIRRGARGRFFNVVGLVNKREAETRAKAASPTALPASTASCRTSPATSPSRSPAASCCSTSSAASSSAARSSPPQPRPRRMAHWPRRHQEDHRAPRPAHASLRHRRDRQRVPALQEPRLTTPPARRPTQPSPHRLASDSPLQRQPRSARQTAAPPWTPLQPPNSTLSDKTGSCRVT